ncbi:hypothetical protein Tco_0809223 [Tanacetum coccineum]
MEREHIGSLSVSGRVGTITYVKTAWRLGRVADYLKNAASVLGGHLWHCGLSGEQYYSFYGDNMWTSFYETIAELLLVRVTSIRLQARGFLILGSNYECSYDLRHCLIEEILRVETIVECVDVGGQVGVGRKRRGVALVWKVCGTHRGWGVDQCISKRSSRSGGKVGSSLAAIFMGVEKEQEGKGYSKECEWLDT